MARQAVMQTEPAWLWPVCTRPGCHCARSWPDEQAMRYALDDPARSSWTDPETGRATCLCHRFLHRTFPCDRAVELNGFHP